jgi:uncharacterized protein YraI
VQASWSQYSAAITAAEVGTAGLLRYDPGISPVVGQSRVVGVGPCLVESPAYTARAPGLWERGTGRINGILSRACLRSTGARRSPHPILPDLRIAPAVARFWASVLVAVFSLLIAGSTPAFAQTSLVVVTDPDGVHLRSGPGTQYPSLALVPRGSELPVLGAKLNTDWIPVSYQGRSGFVHDDYVEVKASASPATAQPMQPSTPAPSMAPAQPGAQPTAGQPTASQPLPSPGNPPLRSPAAGPATTAPPSVSPGVAPVTLGAGSTAAAAAPTQMRVVPFDGVNLRAGPGTDQRILTVIPYNARLTVTMRSPDGRWGQAAYNGQTGWVDTQFLAPYEESREPATIEVGNGKYIWPVAGRSITTPFSGGHPGIDIDQYPIGGNPVLAVAAGKVILAGGNACCSYGLYVKIEHKDGMTTLYAHLQSIDVSEGQEVKQGQSLGLSGNTGFSTGAHLHFEMHMNGVPIDPMGQLPRPATVP